MHHSLFFSFFLVEVYIRHRGVVLHQIVDIFFYRYGLHLRLAVYSNKNPVIYQLIVHLDICYKSKNYVKLTSNVEF